MGRENDKDTSLQISRSASSSSTMREAKSVSSSWKAGTAGFGSPEEADSMEQSDDDLIASQHTSRTRDVSQDASLEQRSMKRPHGLASSVSSQRSANEIR